MEESEQAAISSLFYGKRVALLLCGSFNPPTYAHMRMFEAAKDYLEKAHCCAVVEGILSPVGDSLGQSGLSAEHRLKMAEIAAKNSNWIRADGWECSQKECTETLHVLQHFRKRLNAKYGGGPSAVRLMLLCGGDVFENYSRIGLSTNEAGHSHVKEIVRDFGLIVILRADTEPRKVIYMTDVLREHQNNIHVIEDETFPNNVSSARLRTAVRRNESIRYCTDDEVIRYIQNHGLYASPSTSFSPQAEQRSPNKNDVRNATEPCGLGSPSEPKPFQGPPFHSLSEWGSGYDSAAEQPVWCASSDEDAFSKNLFLLEEREQSEQHVKVAEASSSGVVECSPSASQHLPHTTQLCLDQPQPLSTLKEATLPNPSDSPNYDNVTIEELLAASSHWAEYIGGAKKDTDFVPSRRARERALCRTKSVEEDENVEEENLGEGKAEEVEAVLENVDLLSVSGLPPTSSHFTKLAVSSSEPSRIVGRRATQGGVQSITSKRSIRFAKEMAKSVENLHEAVPLEEDSMTRSLLTPGCESESQGKVTLTYRQYKIAAAPETTV